MSYLIPIEEVRTEEDAQLFITLLCRILQIPTFDIEIIKSYFESLGDEEDEEDGPSYEEMMLIEDPEKYFKMLAIESLGYAKTTWIDIDAKVNGYDD